ncbi:MAG: choice-of-anchor tandem repeat GloVer-containing protein [Terriglobales bacterium]
MHSIQTRTTGRLILLLALACSFVSVAATEWKEKVLYSFQGVPDGAVPTGAVVFDKAGNLYGATLDGGASTCDGPGQCGTVYKLAPPATKGGAWTETVLYIFKGHAQNDGATPEGGLVIDEAGNLYGTTGYGGSGPCLLLGGAVGCGRCTRFLRQPSRTIPGRRPSCTASKAARTAMWRPAI